MTFNRDSQESLNKRATMGVTMGATMLSAPCSPALNEDSRDNISVTGQSQKSEQVKHYPKSQVLNFANSGIDNDDNLYAGDKK